MKAVIIAGGKGTRMSGTFKEVPKALIPIGERPLLDIQLQWLERYGIDDAILLLGHLSSLIEAHVLQHSRFAGKVSFVREDTPRGTAGSVKLIENQVDDDFIVLYGDIMLDMDLQKLIDFHRQHSGIGTLVVHPNDHPFDSDLLEMDQNCRITRFHRKPHDADQFLPNLVNAGAYILSPEILKYIPAAEMLDFGRDIFPRALAQHPFYGYLSAEYIKDMGTPERLEKVRADHRNGKIARLNSQFRQKAIFLDRDGVINKHIGLIYATEQFVLLPRVEEAIFNINRSDYLAILVTNQSVVARNLCSIEGLNQIHHKMETLLGFKGAYLDAIYYCPHHPHKGYPEENLQYKVQCTCRKPDTGLISRAQAQFNLDISRSFMIGDSGTDILCGRRSGMKTVALTNGENSTDPMLSAADYRCDNLFEAVNLIINNPAISTKDAT